MLVEYIFASALLKYFIFEWYTGDLRLETQKDSAIVAVGPALPYQMVELKALNKVPVCSFKMGAAGRGSIGLISQERYEGRRYPS